MEKKSHLLAHIPDDKKTEHLLYLILKKLTELTEMDQAEPLIQRKYLTEKQVTQYIPSSLTWLRENVLDHTSCHIIKGKKFYQKDDVDRVMMSFYDKVEED